MPEKAKPCPFCDSVKVGASFNPGVYFDSSKRLVECLRCGARGPIRRTIGWAVPAWNQRGGKWNDSA